MLITNLSDFENLSYKIKIIYSEKWKRMFECIYKKNGFEKNRITEL